MIIKTLQQKDNKYITQAANLLIDGFKNSWPNIASALEEVDECLLEDRICRIAIDENDNVVG